VSNSRFSLRNLSRRALDGMGALLPAEERARLAAYMLEDCGHGTDAFGTSPAGLAPAYAFAYALHRYYFRVVSSGHEHLPRTGAGVVVGNHSGVLPFDGLMLSADVFRNTDPPRLLRYMVDYFVYRMPYVGVAFRSLGQVPGTRRNFDGLIESGHLIGVFPEGADALGKPATRRYELLPFTHGHVELAARHGVPVIPFGLVGAEEQQTVITDLQPVARALKLPFFPITHTFPWLGPLGLLPAPVRYFIHYGEPIDIDPAATRSVDVRSAEVARVREAVADQIRVGLKVRRLHEEGLA